MTTDPLDFTPIGGDAGHHSPILAWMSCEPGLPWVQLQTQDISKRLSTGWMSSGEARHLAAELVCYADKADADV